MATRSLDPTSPSSSSSDEEERQRLREAVVTDVGIYSYPSNGGIVISAKKPPKPRSEDVSDGEEKHPFGTTPEFRAHMRKEFAKYLDSVLEFKDVHEDSRNILRGPPEGVCPLFTGCPDEPEEIPSDTAAASPCRRQSNGYDSSSSSHSSEHERLAEAAVTCEFLFGSRQPPYSQDQAAHEENGKKRKKKKQKKEKHNRAETLDENSCSGASSDELTQLENGNSKHKMKEKKKKRKEKHKKAESLNEKSCNGASSEELTLLENGDSKHKKKEKKRRKESVKATSSKSSDSSSDELDQQTADDLRKRKKKKKKKKLKTCEDN